jgi:DNA-directed RNA polymerase specialized sigma24 family protein
MGGKKMQDKYDSWSASKSDLQLVEVLKGEDPQDRDLAMQILHDRYEGRLKCYVWEKLPTDWVDDAVQDTWEAFYNYVRVKEVREGVSNLLFGIARSRQADTWKRLCRETAIEDDIDSAVKGGPAMREIEEQLAEFFGDEQKLLWEKQKEFLPHVPYTPFLLAPCERVFWRLREELGFSTDVISKITGRTEGTVNQTLFRARKKVADYLWSEEFEHYVANQELKPAVHSTVTPEPGLIIECFAKPKTPWFTPDEVKPLGLLGLTVEKLQSCYISALALPGSPEERQPYGSGHVLLFLINPSHWNSMQVPLTWLWESLDSGKLDRTQIKSCQELVFNVQVDADNIVLTPNTLRRLWPVDWAKWNTFSLRERYLCSLHYPKRNLPMVMTTALNLYAGFLQLGYVP